MARESACKKIKSDETEDIMEEVCPLFRLVPEPATEGGSLEVQLRNIKFFNEFTQEFSLLPVLTSFTELDLSRRAIYLHAKCFQEKDTVIAAHFTSADTSNPSAVEHLFCWDKKTATPVLSTCGISYDSFSPTCMIEYQYDAGGPYRLSKIALEPFLQYKKCKFRTWEKMLENPECQAAFSRMLKEGPMNHLFDSIAFPIPEDEILLWVAKNEKGKNTEIPRPVFAFRLWDPIDNCYQPLSPLMDGAPENDEALKIYWESKLESLRASSGADYIESLRS